ncbi:MAG: hypothetical protein N2440_02970 [Actinobacteria bacterium]|nr:hypothetical protein [Actinomycetota bacterium]
MRFNTIVVFILLLFLLATSQAFASDNLNDILSKPAENDGKTFSLEGEVVGVAVKSGSGYFIQLNQDPYSKRSIAEGGKLQGQNLAIPVFLSKELYKKIRYFGDYHVKGDIVEIEGVFNASCEEHNGDTDIHANQLKVVKKGYPLKQVVGPVNAGISLFLFLVALLLAFFVRQRQ